MWEPQPPGTLKACNGIALPLPLFIGTLKMMALVMTPDVPPQNVNTRGPQKSLPTAFPVSEHDYRQPSFTNGIMALKIAM
jgi:hypothetical protein